MVRRQMNNLQIKIAMLIADKVERCLLEGVSCFDEDNDFLRMNPQYKESSQEFYLRLAEEVIKEIKPKKKRVKK